MRAQALAPLLLHPGVALKSVLLSVMHQPRRFWELPIVGCWSTSVRSAPGATVRLGGRLFVGHWPSRREGDGVGLGPVPFRRAVLKLGRRSTLVTDGWVILGPGVHVILAPEAELHIGAGTYITANSQVLCAQSIEIGSDCSISWQVLITDTDFHALSVNGKTRPSVLPVRIGDHVWIGANATILKGTIIGDGAVVAAGSVVTRDVPPGALVAGVPAGVVHEKVEWQ